MIGKTADTGSLLLSTSPPCTDALLCRKSACNLLISLIFELNVSKNRRTVIFYCQMLHQGVHKASGSDSMRLALGEGFPSGQRDQTVNLTALPSKVRILLPPPFKCKVVTIRKYPVEGFPSGQRDQTVNLTALPSKVRILLPPPFKCKVVTIRKYPVEGFPSGQRDQTVNLTALPSKVRILLPPPFKCKVVTIRKYPVEGFPSGQRDQTVNLTALPSKVRILLPPPFP